MEIECKNVVPLSSVNLQLLLPMYILNKRARHIEQNYEGFVRLEGLEYMHMLL